MIKEARTSFIDLLCLDRNQLELIPVFCLPHFDIQISFPSTAKVTPTALLIALKILSIFS